VADSEIFQYRAGKILDLGFGFKEPDIKIYSGIKVLETHSDHITNFKYPTGSLVSEPNFGGNICFDLAKKESELDKSTGIARYIKKAYENYFYTNKVMSYCNDPKDKTSICGKGIYFFFEREDAEKVIHMW
jgi:hypothetical protein